MYTPETNPNQNQPLGKYPDLLSIPPAQAFANGVLHFGVTYKDQRYLISSNRVLTPFAQAASLGLKLQTLHYNSNRFSRLGIEKFLEGGYQVDPVALYEKLRAHLNKYIYLRDPKVYDFLALWIMGTYVFRVFRYYPYVHLHGEKQSGKSILLEVLEPIVFNGSMMVGSTAAAIFRKIENESPTLLLDEAEYLTSGDRDRNRALMEVLKSGHNHKGRTERCGSEKEGYRPISFATYCPKIIGGINPLDDVLGDRAIPIRMVRKEDGEADHRYKDDPAMQEFHQQLRDELYAFGLMEAVRISETYNGVEGSILGGSHLSNRELDLWESILVLANLLDGHADDSTRTNTMEQLSLSVQQYRKEADARDNDTGKLLRALHLMVKNLRMASDRSDVLEFWTDDVEKWLRENEDISFPSKTALTRRLNAFEITTANRWTADGTKRVYRIDILKLLEYMKRYCVPEEV